MIKIIVCDIDGTLLPKNQEKFSSDVVLALEKQHNAGKKIVFASGRTYSSMRYLTKDIGFSDDIYYICNDGSLCIYNDKVLYHKQISIENMLKFARNPEYSELPIMYYSDKFSYVSGTTPEFIDKLEEAHIDILDPVSGVYDVKAPIYKIGVYGINKKPVPKLVPSPFDLRVCYDADNILEYTSKFANKGLALSDLQMRLYLSKLDTAAFGDGENDIEMFSKAKYAYAKKDGSRVLLNVANNYFDNIAEAIYNI